MSDSCGSIYCWIELDNGPWWRGWFGDNNGVTGGVGLRVLARRFQDGDVDVE